MLACALLILSFIKDIVSFNYTFCCSYNHLTKVLKLEDIINMILGSQTLRNFSMEC